MVVGSRQVLVHAKHTLYMATSLQPPALPYAYISVALGLLQGLASFSFEDCVS